MDGGCTAIITLTKDFDQENCNSDQETEEEQLHGIIFCFLLEMYPSFGSARFDSVLTRVFKEKARLGSLTFPKNSVYRKRPKRVDFQL